MSARELTHCPECGSESTSLESGYYDPQDRCLFDTFKCHDCGLTWSERLICEDDDTLIDEYLQPKVIKRGKIKLKLKKKTG